MKYFKITVLFLFFFTFFSGQIRADEKEDRIFRDFEAKKQFATDVAALMEAVWGKWQEEVRINDIDVEGSRGVLLSGDITSQVLTGSSMMNNFDRKGKSQGYIRCVKTFAGGIENGMRAWQRGYSHQDIPFPQGANCSFTLLPCNNVPVTIDSGASTGDNLLTKDALYSYMIYHAPDYDESVLVVFRAASEAFSECFALWKKKCAILDIQAQGGIAPAPMPMGSCPGPVRNAKGSNGRFHGDYLNTVMLYNKMVSYFEKYGNLEDR